MYNMDNQNMMNNMNNLYQQQYQFNPSFANANNPQTQFYPTSNPQPTVSTQFNLGAQPFVPSTAIGQVQQVQQVQGMPAAQIYQPNLAMQPQPHPQPQPPPTTNNYMYNPTNNLTNEASILKEKLQRRLAKDIEEFQAKLCNFPNFNAMPLKDKLEEWHFNVWPVAGVYADYCINGVINFPTQYPQKPPTIELSVPIPHPNVKSISSKAFVQLDILSSSRWKQSYSILDIFRELSAAFCSTTVNEIGDSVPSEEIERAHTELKTFKCMWTGHTSQNPVPKKGQPIPHSRKQINQLQASQPLTIENQAYQWRYCRIKQIECSFGKVYYEARVVSSVLGPNNLTTIQIGWALPPDDDPALGEEFEYVVLGNRYYMQRIGGVIIHKRPFEISHNNQLPMGFGDQNDKIVCAADFETKNISFYINGASVGMIEFPKSFIESDKPLVPVIGLSYASVELNFKNLNLSIPDITSSYLTIQEYLQIDRSDWVWERGSLVDWNVLFTYGLPMDESTASNDAENNESDRFRQIVLEIFHCLGFETLSKCREVCKIWNEVINRAYFVHRSKLKCYYSDKSFDNKETEIGLMLHIKEKSELISCSRDCISFNVWHKLDIHIDSKHEEFTHFLPIIINQEHGKRISKILTKQIANISERPGFRSDQALFILASLLNSVVKSLHRELFVKKNRAAIAEALNLWCHLHHILLFLCIQFPAMQTAADSRIRELFDKQPPKSSKSSTNKQQLSEIADLGILIMYLLISENYTWHTIRRLWVEESFSRDCKKLCSNQKNQQIKNRLDNIDLADKQRLDIMYKHTKESRSLTRLLISFITLPQEYNEEEKKDDGKHSIEEKLRFYNLRYGSPHPQWISEIEDKAEEISNSRLWSDYFTGIFVVAPPTKVLSNLLFRCFVQGAQQGYYQIKSKLNASKPPQQPQTHQHASPQQQRDRHPHTNGQRQQMSHPQRDRDNRDNRDRDNRDNRDRDRGRGRGRGRNMMRGDRDRDRDIDRGRDRDRDRGRGRGGGRGRGRDDRGRDRDRGRGRGGGRGRGRDNYNDRGPISPVKSDRFKDFRSDNRERGGGDRFNNRERGGRGGRDFYGRSGRGGRGGRRGDDYHDPNFNPDKQVSKYTGFSHKAQAIASLSKFPEWIRDGCKKNAMKKFNALQKSVMGDLCLGNDSVVVAAPGSGKTSAAIMAAFYRLYTEKAPTHIMFICVDHIHAEVLRAACCALGEFVPDLKVIPQVRGSRFIGQRQLSEGRNIFICSPGKAINLCENGRAALTENLMTVTIFDCDTLLVEPLFLKLKATFKWIPTNINVNFVACSMCGEVEQNMAQLVSFESAATKKFVLTKEYSNLKFWFIFCGKRHLRVPMLNELCKVNPYRQGVIFCAGPHQAKIVQDSLKSLTNHDSNCSFKSRILESDSINETNEIINGYNNGSISYVIAHEYSPIHMLYQINEELLKIIINFEIRSSSSYLKRANIAKFVAPHKKIHVISLIDEDQTKIYEHVEENCKVQLIELPSSVADVLCDEDQNDDSNENKAE